MEMAFLEPPHHTSLWVALHAILYVAISLYVIACRRKYKQSNGVPNDPTSPLYKIIRAQANFNEYVPLALIQLALLEMLGLSTNHVHILGGLLFVARIMQAYGLGIYQGVNPFRFLGTLFTFLILIWQAIQLVVKWIP